MLMGLNYIDSKFLKIQKFSLSRTVTNEFISKTTFTVIPACLESFPLVGNLKKDAGQASMTDIVIGM